MNIIRIIRVIRSYTMLILRHIFWLLYITLDRASRYVIAEDICVNFVYKIVIYAIHFTGLG